MNIMFTALAYAETAGESQEPSLLASIFPLIVVFIIFYFLLIRPEQKKKKAHEEMVSELKVGDTIVTKGGIIGIIEKLEEESINIKVSGTTKLKLIREAVSALNKPAVEKKKAIEEKKEDKAADKEEK